MQIAIHPFIRILFFITGILGAILCTNNLLLLFFWIAILIPLMVLTGNGKAHFKFILVVVLPMTLMLFFLFGVVLHKTIDNFASVIQTILKLINYTTIFQVVLLIPPNQVYYTFKSWGMKGGTLVTFLGSYIVWVDITNRSDKILTARFARGFITERTFLTRLKQIPYLLIPLIIGIMRTAVERSESWKQKGLLYRIQNLNIKKIHYSIILNSLIFIIAMAWLIINIYEKWM